MARDALLGHLRHRLPGLPLTPALLQDVYKSVTQPRAFACVLRLRCSPELRLASYYGRLTADR